MAAPLEAFLRAITSGHNVLSREMLDHFGGDDIIKALQAYDPDARLTETTMPGESNGQQGWRVDFDWSKLPKSQAGSDWSINPSNLHDKVKNPAAVYDDPVYGNVTNSANFYKDAEPLWTKLAPMAVGALAPMAGAALAGAGIGGAAGLTAGVTGSGLTGVGTLPSWAVQLIGKAPNLAQSAHGGDYDSIIKALLGAGGSAFGINPNYIKAGMTLAQLAKRP